MNKQSKKYKSVFVGEDLHRQLKVMSAIKGISINKLISQLLEESVLNKKHD